MAVSPAANAHVAVLESSTRKAAVVATRSAAAETSAASAQWWSGFAGPSSNSIVKRPFRPPSEPWDAVPAAAELADQVLRVIPYFSSMPL